MIIKNKWYNCYDVSWGKNIISKAYVHPANVLEEMVRLASDIAKKGV